MHSQKPNDLDDVLQAPDVGEFFRAVWFCALITLDQACFFFTHFFGPCGWHVRKKRLLPYLEKFEQAGYLRARPIHTIWPPILRRNAVPEPIGFRPAPDFDYIASQLSLSLPEEAPCQSVPVYLPGPRLKDFIRANWRVFEYPNGEDLCDQESTCDYHSWIASELESEFNRQSALITPLPDILPRADILPRINNCLITRLLHSSEIYLRLRNQYQQAGNFLVRWQAPARVAERTGRVFQFVEYFCGDFEIKVNAEVLALGLDAKALRDIWTTSCESPSDKFKVTKKIVCPSITGQCRIWGESSGGQIIF